MKENQVNLPIFLEAIFGGVPELVSNQKVKYARTALTTSLEFAKIIECLYRRPRKHGKAISARGGSEVMHKLALKVIKRDINAEMRSLKPLMRLATDDITEDILLSISMPLMAIEAQQQAPVLWELMRTAALTNEQSKRNTLKDPTLVTVL